MLWLLLSYLSKAPLLLSTKSADEESSFPTFTFVIPVQHNILFYSRWRLSFIVYQWKTSQPTQDALLRWRRHNESIWSMFLRKLLIEAEEVTEASSHCESLAAEHGQCGLKESLYRYPHLFTRLSFLFQKGTVHPQSKIHSFLLPVYPSRLFCCELLRFKHIG